VAQQAYRQGKARAREVQAATGEAYRGTSSSGLPQHREVRFRAARAAAVASVSAGMFSVRIRQRSGSAAQRERARAGAQAAAAR